MSLFTMFITAFGLSMDAFAVSISSGIVINKIQMKNILKIAFFFGFFQAFMPLIGWFLGQRFSTYIIQFDHWIAFIVLSFIGLKMIYESLKENDEADIDPLNTKMLLILSIATSIDALAVGVSFAFLKVSIFTSALIIGIVTLVVSFFGVIIGRTSGALLKKKAEIAGGIILTFIGTKILFEHLNISLAAIMNFIS